MISSIDLMYFTQQNTKYDPHTSHNTEIFKRVTFVYIKFIMLGNTIAKAPGKVLIVGGYGVLEEGNVGLSLAVDKYFFSVSSKIDAKEDLQNIMVKVKSPQIGQNWEYSFTQSASTIKETNQKVNPFIENALRFSLIYAFSHTTLNVSQITIIILQDRGFLSESSSNENKRFLKYSSQSTKTGLGSSAGVVVVTVSAILQQIMGAVPQRTINLVSQVANLAAQCKIGSNFDISTAVYGSHLYTNLLPRTAFTASTSLDFKQLETIDPQVEGLKIKCDEIKRGYCCMLDLKKGSNTRKMVSGFIKVLGQQSAECVNAFYTGSKAFVHKIHRIITEEENIQAIKLRMKEVNKEYRQFLQGYSTITGVPVEPPEFKPFLDRICSIDNVIYAICPGSGGYDAIFIMSSVQHEHQASQFKAELKEICLAYQLEDDIADTKILWDQPFVTEEDSSDIADYLQHCL